MATTADHRPVLLAVDGPSLGHRFYHALQHTSLRTPAGRPAWAVHGFVNQLLAAAARFSPAAVVVGFDDPGSNTRRVEYPPYKGNRGDRDPDLVEQLDAIVQLLTAAGVHVVVPPGLEADDVLASAATRADTAGWRTVLVTSDKDAYALISDTVTLLRVTGGVERCPLITPADVVTALRVRPDQYRDLAALRGDKSDALPGVPGVGPVYATKLLLEFGTAGAVFDAAAERRSRVAAVVGAALATRLAAPESRQAFELNQHLMTMRTDLDLGCAAGAVPGRLPLDPVAVTAALSAAGLDTVRAAAIRLLAPAPAQTRPEDPPPAVTGGRGGPYHCSAGCGRCVAPAAKSIARREPVICRACDRADPRMARFYARGAPVSGTDHHLRKPPR